MADALIVGLSAERRLVSFAAVEKCQPNPLFWFQMSIPIALIIIGSLAYVGILSGVGAICGFAIGLTGASLLLALIGNSKNASKQNLTFRIITVASMILYAIVLTQSILTVSGCQLAPILSCPAIGISTLSLGALDIFVVVATVVYYRYTTGVNIINEIDDADQGSEELEFPSV